MSFSDNTDAKKPWETLDSNIVYETPWIKVREDKVKTSYGKSTVYSYIEKDDYVSAVVLDSKNEIYLVGQYRYPVREFTWEVIQGGIEKGESSLASVKREVLEEIGVVANNYELIFKDFISNASLRNSYGSVYLVRDIIQEREQNLDSCEEIIIKKVPFSQALEMVYKGEIRCVSSCFSILLAAKKLNI